MGGCGVEVSGEVDFAGDGGGAAGGSEGFGWELVCFYGADYGEGEAHPEVFLEGGGVYVFQREDVGGALCDRWLAGVAGGSEKMGDGGVCGGVNYGSSSEFLFSANDSEGVVRVACDTSAGSVVKKGDVCFRGDELMGDFREGFRVLGEDVDFAHFDGGCSGAGAHERLYLCGDALVCDDGRLRGIGVVEAAEGVDFREGAHASELVGALY